MRAGIPLFSLALALLLALARPVAAQPVLPPGAVVGAIEVRADEEVDRERLAGHIELKVGAAFDPAALRRTLSNLHADGAFAEAEALARPGQQPGELVLVLVLRSRPRIAAIEFSGQLGLKERLLRQRQELRVDAPFQPEKRAAGEKALAELYRRSGYFEARVSSTLVQVGPHRVSVQYSLQSGPRAKVGRVGFTGNLAPLAEEQLRAPLKLREGANFDRDRLDSERRRLRRFLVRAGYLQATVEPATETYDAARAAVDLTFELEVGPRVEVAVVGERLEKLRKRGLLSFFDDTPLDEISLEQSRQRILADLQQRGFYQAKVTARLVRVDEANLRVELTLERGPSFRLGELHFDGVAAVDPAALRRLMSVAPRQPFLPGSGIVTDAELDADLANLTSYYRLQGFGQAKVGPPSFEITPPEPGEGRGRLALHLPIEEGPRQRVVDIVLDGVALFEREELLAKLPLRRGGPFHPLLLDDSINVLRALYEEEGYAFAQVEPKLEWNSDGTLVDVLLTLDEGPQLLLDRLILRGQVHTDPQLITRSAGLAPGSIVSRRRLVRAQRDLYRLGIFSRVEVKLAPAGDSGGRRDVFVEVQEANSWRLSYGFSYHSEDGIGGLFGLSRLNLGGSAGRLQIDLRGSSNDRRARLVYDRPFLGDARLPLTFALYLRDEENPSFDVRERGAQISLTRDFDSGRLGLLYDYRLVDPVLRFDGPVKVEPLERQDEDVEISSFTPDLLFDHRDDPVDPTRGFSTTLRLEWALPMLQADADFLKIFLQQTWYGQLGRFGVVATSFRAGAIEPFSAAGERDPDLPAGLPNGEVPISERFFAGGRTSHRAYARDALGLLGATLVDQPGVVDKREVGGNGLLLLNFDYRFPVTSSFGGVLFLDVGNVWADWRDIDAAELRFGAGLGVRYKSPIGPVRLELGWKLDPQPWESSSPVFFLSLGNPF